MVKKEQKIAVALSGGVDSATVAYLLRKQGHDLIGLHMRLKNGNDETERAVRAICKKLNIKYYPVNLSEKFNDQVVKYFLSSYEKGATPNPCVVCNKKIKFNELLRVASELGCDYLATGHYARLGHKLPIKLTKSKDEKKDQTYFLYKLTQGDLSRILFPLGDLVKDEVRKIADKARLPYIKKESQDVCFLNQNGKIIEHNDYLKKHLKLKTGPIKMLSGQVIGKHQGLPLYTIGQRRGIEIGGRGPYYAAKMDYKKNILYVTDKFDDLILYGDKLIAKDVNWTSGREPKLPLTCEAVIRYRHKAVRCRVESNEAKKYRVIFKEPQRAITPGQSVVFYKKDEMLGGGTIFD